ncbi:unnamed protein product [Plutella xylostella]|uniref:(diamondback moth) hypothetical protein n=1 Tax=Plutella xylostella TaxID=51655 RepID=A0A8S4G9K7_PLUXY|nr:unnamed protein product [Plutella xylostella]
MRLRFSRRQNGHTQIDTSVPNLRYLTADQALADLAQFITHVKSEQFEDGKYR